MITDTPDKPLATYYTVGQIAKSLNYDNETVRTYIRSGKLKAMRIGREYRVAYNDYQQFLSSMNFH